MCVHTCICKYNYIIYLQPGSLADILQGNQLHLREGTDTSMINLRDGTDTAMINLRDGTDTAMINLREGRTLL